MNFYLSIAFTLLAGVAGMYLLAKTRTESLGKFFSFVAYTVIVIAGLSLLCQLGRAACWMACGTGICTPSENCMPGMMIHKEIRMHGMNGCQEDEDAECCDQSGHGEGMNGCCEMKGGHGRVNKDSEGKQGCMHDEEKEEHGMKMDSGKTK